MFDDFMTQVQSDEIIPDEWIEDYNENPMGFCLGMFAFTQAIHNKIEKSKQNKNN